MFCRTPPTPNPPPRWALCTHIVMSEQILGPVKIPACRRRTLTLCSSSSSSSSSLLAAVTSASFSPRLSPPQPPSLPTSSHLRCAVTPLSVGAVGRPPVQPDEFLSEYLGTKVARSALPWTGPLTPGPHRCCSYLSIFIHFLISSPSPLFTTTPPASPQHTHTTF